MELNQATAAVTASANSVRDPVATGTQTAAVSSDFETFLKMLTTQMQNQDPLNPIDSSDYAVQLATFSGVEQQVKTNDLLTSMTSQMNLMGMAQLSGWVGMEARSEAAVKFQGSPVTIVPTVTSTADSAFLLVKNEAGTIVQRTPVPVSNEPITWAGVQDNGTPLPAGNYTFSVESFGYGNLLETNPAQSYGVISEARIENGQTMLVMASGGKVAADSVTALRDPQAISR